MNVRLMVLGLLARGPRHGYELRKLAEQNRMESWAGILPGSIYHALKQLLKEGLIRRVATERTGRRTREVFAITAAGRRALIGLVRQAWRAPIRTTPSTLYGALLFRGIISPAEEAKAIEAQRADLEAEIRLWEKARPLKELPGDQAAVYDNGLDHLRADLKLIRRLAPRVKGTHG